MCDLWDLWSGVSMYLWFRVIACLINFRTICSMPAMWRPLTLSHPLPVVVSSNWKSYITSRRILLLPVCSHCLVLTQFKNNQGSKTYTLPFFQKNFQCYSWITSYNVWSLTLGITRQAWKPCYYQGSCDDLWQIGTKRQKLSFTKRQNPRCYRGVTRRACYNTWRGERRYSVIGHLSILLFF